MSFPRRGRRSVHSDVFSERSPSRAARWPWLTLGLESLPPLPPLSLGGRQGRNDRVKPQNLGNLLGALASMVTDRVSAAIVEKGLSSTQATAIALLGKYPGCSIEDLRGPLELSHSGCVRLVDRLEGLGFIERRAAGADGRAVALSLTQRGQSLLLDRVKRREDVLRRAVATLGPEDQAEFGRMVTMLLAHGNTSEAEIGRTCRLCDYEACVVCPFNEVDSVDR